MLTEWIRVTGRLHPMVLHLPIGLLAGLVVLEIMSLRRPEVAWRRATGIMAWLAAIAAAVAAGFARAVTEVGCAMIVGGNIKDKTRLLTTAIVTESNRGEFATALAMGLVLVVVALFVNLSLRRWVVE